MRPTPEDTLAGAERLLRELLADGELAGTAAATVEDVARMLKQARRSVAEAPAFLAADNDRLRDLLAALVRDLPATDTASREQIRAYLLERVAADPR